MAKCPRRRQPSLRRGTVDRRTLLGSLAAGTLLGCGQRHNLTDHRWPSNQVEALPRQSQASISALEERFFVELFDEVD